MKPKHVAVFSLIVLAGLGLASGQEQERLRVVTSTEDLASIARMVGGDLVEVESIAKGTQDPHFVELLPSYMVRVRRAKLYVKVGMSLDYWAQQIIDGSRNARLIVVDASAGLPREQRLEVPTGKVDASMGDVHPDGNPHYWLDPANGVFIAEAIAEGLGRAYPERSKDWQAGLARFEAELERRIAGWKAEAAPLQGMRIITYHRSWSYFARAFGITVVDHLEPKPGVKPSPSHVASLIGKVQGHDVALVAFEPYFERKTPEMLSRETGIPAITLPPSVGGVPEVKTYFDLFEYDLRILKEKGRR
jgi:ABC-type Zn uptake system ZnuABC Zn-binding protein ZnuA